MKTWSRALTTLTFGAVVLQAYNMWNLGHGRIAYPVMILAYLLFLAVELMLALRDKWQIAILGFVALDIWALTMAIYGWLN